MVPLVRSLRHACQRRLKERLCASACWMRWDHSRPSSVLSRTALERAIRDSTSCRLGGEGGLLSQLGEARGHAGAFASEATFAERYLVATKTVARAS